MSPTQRSLAKLRKEGYRVAIVEKWNPHAKIRQDLFGVVDILAIRGSETLAVQSTSGSNVSSRVKKIAEAEATAEILAAGWKFVVHGWRKLADKKWNCREVNIAETDP